MIIKQDIQKKKQALNEEKALINERLNARKSAMDKEDQYEKLSELRKQIALVSADPTRTKELKDLQKEYNDLMRETSISRMEEEANAEMERLDEQQKAYEDYVTYNEGKLNEMLENANSPELANELSAILGNGNLTREEQMASYLDFIKKNDNNYKYGTEAMRTQMEQNAVDSLNKMVGFVETYWTEVRQVITDGAEAVSTFLTEKLEQRGLSATSITLQGISAEEMYDNYISSLIDNATWSHDHEIVDAVGELKDYTYKVEITGGREYDYGTYDTSLKYTYTRDKSVDSEAYNYDPNDKYSDVYGSYASMFANELAKEAEVNQLPVIEINVSGGSSSSSSVSSNKGSDTTTQTQAEKYGYKFYDENANKWYDSGKIYDTEAEALTYGETMKKTVIQNYRDRGEYSKIEKVAPYGSAHRLQTYFHGGLVDYTGPAWVDGSKSMPEAFLSAYDTESIRMMLDAFNYVRTMPYMTNIDTNRYSQPSFNVGDVNVNLYEAKLENDADYDEIARKVGKAFTKQIQKDGLNLASYAW